MNSRKKFIIILSTLSVVFIISVIALTLVLVAKVQSAKAVIQVKYEASMVSAELTASYTIGNTTTLMREGGLEEGETKLVFGPESTSEQTLAPVDAELLLDKENKKIIFEFACKNMSETIDIVLTCEALPDTEENVTKKYNITDTQVIDFESTAFSDNLTTIDSDELITGTDTDDGKIIVRADTTKYIYVVVEVSSLLYNASYIGDFSWVLDRYVEVAE